MAGPEEDFVTDETGAFTVYRHLAEVLAWWIREWDHADIKSRGEGLVHKALGLVPGDDESGGCWIGINGREWT